MALLIKNFSDANTFGNVEVCSKTYKTQANAEAAVHKLLDGAYYNANLTIVVTQNSKGRFVPVCIFQGEDATQACIDTARQGFMSFA